MEDTVEAATEILVEVLIELAGETELAQTELVWTKLVAELVAELIVKLKARAKIRQLEELKVFNSLRLSVVLLIAIRY